MARKSLAPRFCVVASDLGGPHLPELSHVQERGSEDGGMRHVANHDRVPAIVRSALNGKEGDIGATMLPPVFH